MNEDPKKGDPGKKGPAKKIDKKKPSKPYSEREKGAEENREPEIRNFVLGKKRRNMETQRGNKPKGRKKEPDSFKKSPPQKSERKSSPGFSDKQPEPDPKFDKFKGDLIRLNRYIANAGVCSRRDADVLIQQGEIKVNDKVVTEMGHKVKLSDKVKYKNKVLSIERPVYVLLNKPKNFITTTDDPEERKTVMQLVASACEERIYPVGRLDRNTTGLIILTNDGDLAKKLSHPSHEVKKLYQVDLDKPLTNQDFLKIQEGVVLEDGKAQVDEIAFVTPDHTSVGVELHIGRNRIVRRIFEHLGYEVVKLDRVMYAGLDKKDLPRGEWRFLREKEVIRLKALKAASPRGGQKAAGK